MSERIKDWPRDSIARDESVAEPDEGSARIQWKGTTVCMDVHCKCGFHGHVDADFAYFYRCKGCAKLFAIGSTVRLYEVDEAQQDKRYGQNPVTDHGDEEQRARTEHGAKYEMIALAYIEHALAGKSHGDEESILFIDTLMEKLGARFEELGGRVRG